MTPERRKEVVAWLRRQSTGQTWNKSARELAHDAADELERIDKLLLDLKGNLSHELVLGGVSEPTADALKGLIARIDRFREPTNAE